MKNLSRIFLHTLDNTWKLFPIDLLKKEDIEILYVLWLLLIYINPKSELYTLSAQVIFVPDV